MFGIEDTWVALAYLLCLASTGLCVVYGLVNWNRGQEEPEPADIQWAQEEERVEADL